MSKLHVAQKQHAYIQIIRYEQRSKIDLALDPLSRFVPTLVVYPRKIVCITEVVNSLFSKFSFDSHRYIFN